MEQSSLKTKLKQGFLPTPNTHPPPRGGTGFTFSKRIVGLGNFPNLSLYIQVRISIVSYFIGNTFGEFSITRQFKWIKSLFHYSLIRKKK